MTDPTIRAAIDAAIRAHLEGRRVAPPRAARAPSGSPSLPPGQDASHAQFADGRFAGDPPAGRCVIEPSVDCVHCGYCRSQGY